MQDQRLVSLRKHSSHTRLELARKSARKALAEGLLPAIVQGRNGQINVAVVADWVGNAYWKRRTAREPQRTMRCAICGGLNPGDASHTRCM